MNKRPTTEQLQKYVAGQLSRAEQYKVERAALNDPFVADAIDGLMMSNNTTDNLTELRARLQKRVNPKETQRLGAWFWASAAAVVLGVGLGWIYIKEEKTTEPVLSMVEPIVKEQTLQIEELKPQKEESVAAIEIPKPQRPILNDNASIQEKTVVATDEVETKAEIAPTTEKVEAASPALMKAAPMLSVVNVSKIDSGLLAAQITVRGVIRAADGSVLPGVSVNVVGTNRGASTDVNGVFRLDNTQTGDKLRLSYVGFDSREITVKDTILQQIILREDNKILSEVVVIGQDRKAKRVTKKATRKANRKLKKAEK